MDVSVCVPGLSCYYFSCEDINESSPARSLIAHDSYLVQFRIMATSYLQFNTRQGLHEHQITHDPKIEFFPVTRARATSYETIAAFVFDAYRSMEQDIGRSGVNEICGYLIHSSMRRFPPGSPTMAVIKIIFAKNIKTDIEGYLSKFRERLVHKHEAGILRDIGTCSVCLDEFDDQDDQEIGVVMTGCSYYFHDKCIGVWMICKTTCPLCRKQVKRRS